MIFTKYRPTWPTKPTDSRGSLPIFYSSQRIPILLVRHTAFGNCYWKKNSCFFPFCVRFSLPRSYYTRLLLHSTKCRVSKCRRLHHFASFFWKFSGGHAPGPPRDACDCVAPQPTAFPSKRVGRYATIGVTVCATCPDMLAVAMTRWHVKNDKNVLFLIYTFISWSITVQKTCAL